ncbi:MAG TPA: cyclic nucleotide-binding domain-containing protein [Bdellovibrionota bacterium]|jgi:hypothetical protein
MELKPFEAGRYDEESIVVANPTNGKQELFTEREFAIVKFLKQNETQSLLALLMPNIGIAKKSHITMCLKVLGKLKRIQVADYFAITGRKPLSNTNTVDLPEQKATIEFASLHPLAATVYGIAGKALAPLGQAGLLGLVIVSAALAFALFPFDGVAPALQAAAPSYFSLFVLAYVAGSLAFCVRALVQGAFLKSFGRDVQDPVFGMHIPLITLAGDHKAVNLLGFKARAQMDVIGLAAPFLPAAIFTLSSLVGLLGPVQAFVGFSTCVAVSLVLVCPLIRFDGADLMQALFFRDQLEAKVADQLREVFAAKGQLGREMMFSLFLGLIWVVVWLDCLQSFREIFSARLAEDFSSPVFGVKFGAVLTVGILAAMLAMPVMVVVFHHLRQRVTTKRKRVMVQKDKVKDSLTFEERVAALEKIPLFASLNDQERVTLLNEMHPAFYNHGTYLVHQGELGREFFVLVKGHASAHYTDVHGKKMVLADLVEGDAFGEIALIDDVPRTASIVSDGGCIALVLRKEGFDRFAESLGSADRVKAMVRLTSFFRRHPLFSKLSPRDQAQLIDNFHFQTITSGEKIPDGDENFHVVYSGTVRVDTGGADGETTLQSDDCFGYSNPLSARYIALEGTGLLSVPKTEFHNLIWEKLVEKPELFV